MEELAVEKDIHVAAGPVEVVVSVLQNRATLVVIEGTQTGRARSMCLARGPIIWDCMLYVCSVEIFACVVFGIDGEVRVVEQKYIIGKNMEGVQCSTVANRGAGRMRRGMAADGLDLIIMWKIESVALIQSP